jgi:hypothetical protein
VIEVKRLTAWSEVDGVPPLEERALVPPPPPPPEAVAWPAEALRTGKVPAPKLSDARLLAAVKAFDARSGFGEGLLGDDSERGCRGGQLVLRVPTRKVLLIPLAPERLAPAGLPADFAVEVSGSAATWGLAVSNGSGTATPCRATVLLSCLTDPGRVWVSSVGAAGSMRTYLGHASISGGTGAANTLLLVVRGGRTVEVYVNGAAVCDPLVLGQELTAPAVALEVQNLTTGDAFAEFASVRLWRADGLPTAEQRGATSPPKAN